MFCPSCGAEANQKTKFCKRCGANLDPTTNVIEINLPRPRVAAMVTAIVGFSFAGLVAALTTLSAFTHGDRPTEPMVFVFVCCLLFVFAVAGLLVWQLARLINSYKDAVQQTIQKAQFEPVAAASPLPPQPQPLYIPAPQESASSVTEHTTRSFKPALFNKSDARE
jgi:hypothetical protein